MSSYTQHSPTDQQPKTPQTDTKMSTAIGRISTVIMANIRCQRSQISAVKCSSSHGGFGLETLNPTGDPSAGSATVLFPTPGYFSTDSSPADSKHSQRIPSESDVAERLRVLESRVDTESLTDTEKEIHNVHIQAVKDHQETYADPVTGYQVYTLYAHVTRGSCCGNACRHCPYDHENVSQRYKSIKKHNGAFYC